MLVERLSVQQLNQPDKDGFTPLSIACWRKNTEIAKILIPKLSAEQLNHPDNQQRTPLFVACETGRTEIVKMLVERLSAQQLNQPHEDGTTPLSIACWHQQIEAAKALIPRLSADQLSEANNQQRTPLFVACKMDLTEIVELLVQKLSVEQLNLRYKNENILEFAARLGRADILCLLLSVPGIDMDTEGGTLHLGHSLKNACSVGRIKTIEKLLLHGAHLPAWAQEPQIFRQHPELGSWQLYNKLSEAQREELLVTTLAQDPTMQAIDHTVIARIIQSYTEGAVGV